MLIADAIDDLHLVRSYRNTIRRFWGLEIGFADRRGQVASHARGVAVPPPNAWCKASLAQAEGFQRCNRSVEEATMALEAELRAASPRPRGPSGLIGEARIVQQCHMGFPVLMAPVANATRFFGALFTGGFRLSGQGTELRRSVERGGRLLRLDVGDTQAAWDAMPVLTTHEVDQLGYLLEQCAEEVLVAVRGQSETAASFGDLIGSSDRMQQLYLMLSRVARSDATVLVIGENGTGKEVIARSIHEKGPRRDLPFVATNCGALAESLLESELFGHVKGAFTGAIRDKPGLFLAADKGTLFLDEVGDTTPAMQVKLLRVLQEGSFTPVGATRPVQVDVRVIAATNRPLAQMVEDGTFREDLFYRLNVIGLEVPPLRDRKGDLPALCEHFLAALGARNADGRPRRLAASVMEAFYEFDWPGNVRQLENEIERLVVLSSDVPEIGPAFLSPAIRRRVEEGPGEAVYAVGSTLDEAKRAQEKRVIAAGLIRTNWNKSRLAKDLAMSRTTLIKKIKEFDLDPSGTSARSGPRRGR